ncbi:hypothetical protein P3J6_120661 [Pseudoalteromonas sp. 3J6]|uniref:hypothetical protein n=1 Tax=Pseudoalteromonas sp. 3J6 TaxID=649161 RepID=UPI001767FFD8|nr:hypothetical protein [Pseudoalteromonas sp. 3J6]CAD2224833.1 hypothetical protein P3J6_120661 [Pseudoalteromonas sp. 3J6]
MNNSQRARKAIRKIFDQSYIDNNPITPEEVKHQWEFLGVIGIPPFKLAQIINKNEVSRGLLQEIFDALNICDFA